MSRDLGQGILNNLNGLKVITGYQTQYGSYLQVDEQADKRELLVLKANGKSVTLDCIIDCSATKNIVSTAINGLHGTIKEWVAEGDVAINVEVTLLSEDNQYPLQKVEELTAILRSNESLQVENETLNNVCGVTRIVVTSWAMTPTKAMNFQTIGFNAVSDEVYKVETNIIQ